jgi:hypothetical protein
MLIPKHFIKATPPVQCYLSSVSNMKDSSARTLSFKTNNLAMLHTAEYWTAASLTDDGAASDTDIWTMLIRVSCTKLILRLPWETMLHLFVQPLQHVLHELDRTIPDCVDCFFSWCHSVPNCKLQCTKIYLIRCVFVRVPGYSRESKEMPQNQLIWSKRSMVIIEFFERCCPSFH